MWTAPPRNTRKARSYSHPCSLIHVVEVEERVATANAKTLQDTHEAVGKLLKEQFASMKTGLLEPILAAQQQTKQEMEEMKARLDALTTAIGKKE